MIIETLKSQDVAATDERGLLVHAKFMARPEGGNAFKIQREAYARTIQAFAEEGIKFAEHLVTVNVPPGTPLDAAAAAAITAAEARKP